MNKHKNIAIIRVPMWYGSNMRGVELAPDILTKALHDSPLANRISNDSTIPIAETNSTWEDTHYVDEIVEANKVLTDKVYEQLQNGHIVLTLGGDHSIGIGSVAGSLKYDENVGLIWFDAHGDMNTEVTSPTGHIHGMPVAALMGLCKSKLNEIPTRIIKPANIFWIGPRDLDEGEQRLASALGLNIYSTDYIHEVGMNQVMNVVQHKMQEQDIRHLHLSFDVDAFDPTLFPATGVPVPNGLQVSDFDEFVSQLSSLPNLLAIDFVEYNSALDDKDMKCKQLAINFLNEMLSR